MRLKGVYLKCKLCGKKYYRCKSWAKGSKYCSRECFNKSRKGKNNPVHRIKDRQTVNKKISEGLLKSDKWKLTEEGRKNLRKANLGRKASKETKAKCRINALNTLQKLRNKGKISEIERIVEKQLIKNNIDFIAQKRLLNITQVDFYLPKNNIALYCDGDYWHNLPDYIKRDKRINKKLKENGYKVLRFWEHQINKSNGKCVIDFLINV